MSSISCCFSALPRLCPALNTQTVREQISAALVDTATARWALNGAPGRSSQLTFWGRLSCSFSVSVARCGVPARLQCSF